MNYISEPGKSIYIASQEATYLSKKHRTDVDFEFNGIKLRTTPDSNPDDIAQIYMLKSHIRSAKKASL